MDAAAETWRGRFVAEMLVPPWPATRASGTAEAPAEALRNLLADYGLVILRGLRLDPAALAAFSQHLGSPQPHPQRGLLPAPRQQVGADSSSRPDPPRYTLLQAVTVPETGGDTLFADVVSAYQHLPPRWKRQLEGSVGIHVHPLGHEPHATGSSSRFLTADGPCTSTTWPCQGLNLPAARPYPYRWTASSPTPLRYPPEPTPIRRTGP